MKRMLTTAMVLGLTGVAIARLRGPATPRATDLLQAEKMAEKVQRRLKVPAKRGAGWQRGGGGWEPALDATEDPPPSVHIEVRPPRRRSRE